MLSMGEMSKLSKQTQYQCKLMKGLQKKGGSEEQLPPGQPKFALQRSRQSLDLNLMLKNGCKWMICLEYFNFNLHQSEGHIWFGQSCKIPVKFNQSLSFYRD